jgi:hypothetical protein
MKILGVIVGNQYISIKDKMETMYSDRVEEISDDMAANDTEYKELHEKIISTQHAMISSMQEVQKGLFRAMDSAEAAIDAYTQEVIYRKAFQDGIEFAQMTRGLMHA